MRDTIDMARAVYGAHTEWTESQLERLKQFEALVRADEREEIQRWFDAVTAQHKQEILAEREACADLCYQLVNSSRETRFAAAIRARGENT